MRINNFIKPIVPHLVAIAIFLFLSLVYFYPVLEGKVLHTNDGTVAQNSSKEISDFREKYGEEPLWTNSMFSGMPAYLISTRYTGNIIRYAESLLRFMKLPVASIFLTMLGFYILLLLFKADPILAIAGAIAYGFSTYFFFILAAGHNTKAYAIAYMAPLIGSIYYAYREHAFKGALLATLFLSLEIVANHPQITYYSLLCIMVFILAELISSFRDKKIYAFLKTSAILIIPVILSIGMNFSSIYTIYEYGKYSIRGKSELVTNDANKTSGLDKDYATQWSYGIDETFTFLIPNFRGGASHPFDRKSETVTFLRKNNATQYINQIQRYWGTQPLVDGPVYVGAIIVFLFILGMIIIKGPVKWWLLGATLFSIMLAWGKNFMPLTSFFLDYFPGYNKFRAVSMTLVIAEFCIPLLGILALRDIFNGSASKKNILKGIKIAFGITGGLTLLFFLFPGLAGSFISPFEQGQDERLLSVMISDRKMLLRSDALRSFILILLGTIVILAFYYEKIKKEYAIALLAFLFLTDLWFVDKRYLNSDKFVRKDEKVKLSAPSVTDNIILKDISYYRVLNLAVSPFNDASTSQFHKSIGGYHGAKMRRYNELIDSSLYPEISKIGTVLENAKSLEDIQPVLADLNGINMLNTKYLILRTNIPPLVNPNALGNAWYVETPIIVNNANEELSGIKRINPSREAIIDKRFTDQVKNTGYPGSPGDKIELKSYKANEIVYKSTSQGERLAIFSEIYYPAGWKCYIDGNENKYFRANYVLRGMVVPAGDHEIKFTFKPSAYIIGNKISLASSMVLILLLAVYFLGKLKIKSKS